MVMLTIIFQEMNYPAASSGISIRILIIAARGGELNPCPPLEDLPASGGLIRLRRIKNDRSGFKSPGCARG